MDVRSHPTWALGPQTPASDRAPLTELQHAGLWLEAHLSDPPVVRRGHLQAVRPPGLAWRLVDLARLPLRLVPLAPASGLPAGAVAELTAWLASWQPLLCVLPELEMVSELGEPPDAFRGRVLGALGPSLRAGEPGGTAGTAVALARLAASVREVACGPAAAVVRSAEVGPLLVPPTFELPPAKLSVRSL